MTENIQGKMIKLIWEDNREPKIKEGKVLDISRDFITLKTFKKTEMIPIRLILRIELKGGNGKK